MALHRQVDPVSEPDDAIRLARRPMVSLKVMIPHDAQVAGRSAIDAVRNAAHDAGFKRTAISGPVRGWLAVLLRLLGRADTRPLVVEIFDTRERLEAFVPQLEALVPHAIIRCEVVELWMPLKVID
jgi:PII-like signaling protein